MVTYEFLYEIFRFFFFNDTATTEIYTLSLHDALPILEGHPERHVWGLGRHHVGSNFFWYLKDPAGNFSEYYSDLDCIVDDALWRPGVWEGMKGLYNWGPPPPPSFLAPDELAGLMTTAHTC